MLRRLNLRQTAERVAVVGALLCWPGLPPSALVPLLAARGTTVHRRTIYRTLELLRRPRGALIRYQVVGPAWVCWGCGEAVASAREDAASSILSVQSVLPLDLGGYCARCQRALGAEESGRPAGLRRGRGPSTFANRRATVIPVGALYQNPVLLHEVLGSSRRLAQRDVVVANLAENPRSGPSAIHRVLHHDLAVVPALRSVKRASGALHSPKAHMLFASFGAVGWACLSCSAWGSVEDPTTLHRDAPSSFFLTDVRGLCPTCREKAEA